MTFDTRLTFERVSASELGTALELRRAQLQIVAVADNFRRRTNVALCEPLFLAALFQSMAIFLKLPHINLRSAFESRSTLGGHAFLSEDLTRVKR
jgi:hypothetical protein